MMCRIAGFQDFKSKYISYQRLEEAGWTIIRIPNSELKGKAPEDQTAYLFAIIQKKLATHKKSTRGFRPESQQAAHTGGGRHGDRTGYQRKGRGRGRWRGRGQA